MDCLYAHLPYAAAPVFSGNNIVRTRTVITARVPADSGRRGGCLRQRTQRNMNEDGTDQEEPGCDGDRLRR